MFDINFYMKADEIETEEKEYEIYHNSRPLCD